VLDAAPGLQPGRSHCATDTDVDAAFAAKERARLRRTKVVASEAASGSDRLTRIPARRETLIHAR